MSFGSLGLGRRSRQFLTQSALASLVLLSAASFVGCDVLHDGSDAVIGAHAAASGGASAAGAAGTPAPSSTGAAVPPFEPPCQLPNVDVPVFAGQGLSNDAPARRELFTWTTAEQVQELRAGSVLLTPTEREGLGPTYAMDVLGKLAQVIPPDPTTDPITAGSIALAAQLSGPSFAKARYAWPQPWATRMGWPGESYGDNLVRLMLRQEAWLARYRNGKVDVIDMDNAPVATADVLADPARLAGVFFVRDGGSYPCGGYGYREFIIGNESMVEEWSLGTAEVRARLDSDLALMKTFFQRIRPCPVRVDAALWNEFVVCGWSTGTTALAADSELFAYEAALAIPSPDYLPSAQPLATLIEALEASLFEADPFVVRASK